MADDWPQDKTTRISLAMGGTLVVYGSVAEARDALSAATNTQAARFQPVAFVGEPTPEVVALRMSDVLILASADAVGVPEGRSTAP